MDYKKRLEKAKANQDLYRDLLQEAYDFIIPSRNNFSSRTEGDEENYHIYDETAPSAIPKFANRMQRSLFPESEEWVQFKAGAEIPEDEKENTDKGLEEYTKVFFSYFNRSNFHREINPAFIDCGISTGVIQVEEELPTSDNLYYFTNIPLNEIAFERPVKGELVNMWRTFKIVADRIKETWPRAKISDQLEKIIKQDPHCEVDISLGQIKENAVYKIVLLWDKDTLLEEEFGYQKLIAFRLNAFPGETFGRGPGINLLPAIRDVNEIQRLTIENAAINVAGIYTARSDGVFNPYTAVIDAGSIWAVSSNDSANPTVARLPAAGDLGMGQIVIQEKQDAINKAFFTDPMGEISDPVRSATEQTMRMQEFLKDQGAAIGRLRSELVEKIVLACVAISTKRGKLPAVRVDGRDVKIVHNTALVKAEQQEDYQSLMTWLNSLVQVVGPEGLPALVKVEELPKGMADMLNVSHRYLRTEEEQKKMMEAAQGAIEAQQEPQ